MNAGLYGTTRGRRKVYSYNKFQGARVARLGSSVTLPSGAVTYIPWDTVVWDTGNVARLSTFPLRLTAPVDGWYEVGFGANIVGGVSGGTSRGLSQFERFNQAGVNLKGLARSDFQGLITFEDHISAVDHFDPGDYVQCGLFQGTGSNRTAITTDLGANLCTLTAYMVRVG